MKRAANKETVDAANYFKEEVLEIMPDISGVELSEMVGEYIYYMQADVGKEEVKATVQMTCAAK